MKNSLLQKITIFTLLLLVPALYLYIGFFFHSEHAYYFMYSVDPEYCYLFNGLNISQFTLKVWHVDHPGTPIQLLAALVIRIVHLFRGNGPLLNDVMQNSALYTNAINIAMFSINSIALFFLGRIANKFSKSIIQSIFLQLTPFASFLVLTLVFRINPENMVILSFILMGILIIKYLQRESGTEKLINRYLLGFAIVTGFSVAVKITFFPVFFVPLFIFKGFWKKAFYCVFSFISFIIFIMPVIYYRHEYFKEWLKNLFIHSGMYGSGAANIVDKSAYINALKETFSLEQPLFAIVFFSTVVACLVYHIPYIKAKIKDEKFYRVLLGIAVSMLFQVLLVAKQFKYHYLTPALLLMIIGMYTVISIYLKNIKIHYKNSIFLILIFLILYLDCKKIQEYHPVNIERKKALYKTYNFIQQNPTDKPLVIVPTYYGCPYQQYSLYFGIYWGGEIMKPRYVEALNEIYPNTYFYNGWDELFHNWNNDPISYIDILKKHNNIRIYVGDSIIENDVLRYVMYNVRRMGDTKVTKIFSNESTHENIYDISHNPSRVVADSVSIVCNADSLNSDGIHFVGTREQSFKDGITQSSEKAFSGKYSSKLTGEKKYGMTYIIGQVRTGEHYRVGIWRYNNNKDAQLVVSARNGDDFYVFENKTVNENNSWGEIVIDIVVPEKLNNKELRIYAFNNTGKPAYFDDLTITAYHVNTTNFIKN
ncbi:MAG: glycosyltransferase 87 family protein [Bacteroidales bacterium]